MKDKVAIDVLKGMLDKHPFDENEKQAILTAIGILAWTKLSESRLKSIKRGQAKRINRDD